MTSVRSQTFKFISQLFLPRMGSANSIQSWRDRTNRLAQRFIHVPKGVTVNRVSAGNVPAEWLVPKQVEPGTVILYLHGGGYTGCSPATHRGLAGSMALHAQAPVLLIDYRLAPEHPFPAALEDALVAYRWLQVQKSDPRHLVISGDSAGGGLGLAAALSLRDEGVQLPVALALLSPWVDLTGYPEYARLYAGKFDLTTPLISPLFADLRGLPPTLIHAGGEEYLLSDSLRLEKKMKTDGVDVQLKVWEGMWHVFQSMTPWVPEAEQSLKDIGKFIKEHMVN